MLMNEMLVKNVRDVKVSDEDGFILPQSNFERVHEGANSDQRCHQRRASCHTICVLLSRVEIFPALYGFFNAPAASNFQRFLLPRGVISPHVLVFSTLGNVNTRVDAVREALKVKDRTLSVCQSLSGFGLQSQIVNANFRPAGFGLFRNIKSRIRV